MLRKVPDDTDTAPGSRVLTVVGVATDVVNGFVYQGKDPANLYLPTSPTGVAGGGAAGAAVRRTTSASTRSGRRCSASIATRWRSTSWRSTRSSRFRCSRLRAASWIGTLLSSVALALSISGLYGVLTYTFGQRTREIGIRMALGASTRAVTRLVVVQSARLACSARPSA